MLAGLVPSEGVREKPFCAALPASGGLLAIFGISCLQTHRLTLGLDLPVCVCVCVSVPMSTFTLFYKDISLIGLSLTLITSF